MFELSNFSSSHFSPQERVEEIIDFVPPMIIEKEKLNLVLLGICLHVKLVP